MQWFLKACPIGDLAYMGVPQAALEDVHFEGYFIPKDSSVIGELYDVMHDERLSKNPDV